MSLAVPWLRFCTAAAEGMGSVMLHGAVRTERRLPRLILVVQVTVGTWRGSAPLACPQNEDGLGVVSHLALISLVQGAPGRFWTGVVSIRVPELLRKGRSGPLRPSGLALTQ